MSHTFQAEQTTFYFNGGGDGNVIIGPLGIHGNIEVPVADVVAFVAELVRRAKIAKLESATDAGILGVEIPW